MADLAMSITALTLSIVVIVGQVYMHHARTGDWWPKVKRLRARGRQ